MTKNIQNQETDHELVDAVANGNKDAFSKLYDRYSQAVFGMIYQATGNVALSEHILEHTFCMFWATAADYNPSNQRCFALLLRISGNLVKESLGVGSTKNRDANNYVHHSEENNKFGGIKGAFQLICTNGDTLQEVAIKTGRRAEELKSSLRTECNTIRNQVNGKFKGVHQERNY